MLVFLDMLQLIFT